MDQTEEQPANPAHCANDEPPLTPAADSRVTAAQSQQLGTASCPACGVPNASGAATASFVYALGRIEPRFPSLGVEKEFAQVAARSATKGLTEQQAFQAVISKRENRYLARQLCWVVTVKDVETYILHPQDPADLDRLVEGVRPSQSPLDLDVIIGFRGPIAPPEICNGLMVPIVVFDHIYSFDRAALMDSLIESLKRRKASNDPEVQKISEKGFRTSADEMFDRIIRMADNAGATDEHRALNYLSVRYDEIYFRAALSHLQEKSLTAQEVRPSNLTGNRKIVDVIFSYTNRNTDVVEKFFTCVDVGEINPFLATKLSPYYDR